jgi:glyoxylase-like metal-dependent hydrolase (beta-lactamase superfamily II)
MDEVADGVWVQQSEWVWTNTTVVRTDDGLVIVDPGIHGSELEAVADHVDRLGVPVVAGFSTHPHWDHLLWHSRFGDVPRYATPRCAAVATEKRELAQAAAAEDAVGVEPDQVAVITALGSYGGSVPFDLIPHNAHAPGHAAVLVADRGVLLAGDMLSDVLIPMLDPRRSGQLAAYEAALDRFGQLIDRVEVLVPGHGSVARGPEVAARLEQDRAYIGSLRRSEQTADVRLKQEWMAGIHASNQGAARERKEDGDG